jgi:hypothetical protein
MFFHPFFEYLAGGLADCREPLRLESVGHPFGEQFNARLRPRTFSLWGRGRHYGATDSLYAIVDGSSVVFDVIVTSQVERLAHPANVSFRKERADVSLKARRFRHCASQSLRHMDVAVFFVNLDFLSLDVKV